MQIVKMDATVGMGFETRHGKIPSLHISGAVALSCHKALGSFLANLPDGHGKVKLM
jgi:hypothetical protein